MDQVRFHFDPICPWCYQTSRWAKRLEELGEVHLDWGLFSLEVVNLKEGEDPREIETRSGPALRTATHRPAAGGTGGDRAVLHRPGQAHLGAGTAREGHGSHHPGVSERHGAGPGLVRRGLADPATWDEVLDEHHALVERTRSFGVPTIVLDGGTGPAIFGPVISALPSDEDAVELWRHVSWLARYENFSELKRDRVAPPDLPAMAWRLQQREQRDKA